jgi:hypothetical protein
MFFSDLFYIFPLTPLNKRIHNIYIISSDKP